MRYVALFPPDTRTSQDKMNIIREGGSDRMKRMKQSEEFQNYDKTYWDDESGRIGYGGYRYDGRYGGTAEKIIDFYGLKPGDSVFELGCGKGFLLVEFLKMGLHAAGVESSRYAYENSHPLIKPRLQLADFLDQPIEEGAYDLVIAKDCLPHMPKKRLKEILEKLIRISKGNLFLEIEVCRNELERDYLYQWDITHITRESPEWWTKLLESVNYPGDYHYKVLVEDPALPAL